MKRILFLITTFVCLCFTACSVNKIDVAIDNLAEVRYNIFSGENDSFQVTFMSGERENPYVVNGSCEERIEFGMLTVKFKTSDCPIVAQYSLTINDYEVSGNLEYNNFENILMVDIGKIVDDDAQISLTVKTNKGDENCDLLAKTKDLEITWRTALEIALTEWGSDFNQYIKKGNLQAELYVKIISDLNSKFDNYYWYVSLIGTDGSSKGLIIDPHSGDIIAKR